MHEKTFGAEAKVFMNNSIKTTLRFVPDEWEISVQNPDKAHPRTITI